VSSSQRITTLLSQERNHVGNTVSPTRRQFIKIGSFAIPLLVVAERSASATNAEMRSALKYQETPNGDQSCAGCSEFTPGSTATSLGGCRLMPGDTEISPHGYCTQWTL
jgi:hypothetical protein